MITESEQIAAKMNLLTQLGTHLSAELATLSASAKGAQEIATHTENRPENKYDTRGLEASYLAGAQNRRILELAGMIDLLGRTVVHAFADDAAVAPTALVELDHQGVRSLWFIVPAGAGYPLEIAGKRVQAITPQSPLGTALLGKRAGDLVRVGAETSDREYEVVRVS